jgi:ferredoxin
MYVVIDEQWRVTTSEASDVSRLAVLVDHPRTALQHLRAVLDGIAKTVSEDSVLLSQAWLRSQCLRSNDNDGARFFARQMERMHRFGIDEEDSGYIRVAIHWSGKDPINRDCLERQLTMANAYDIYVVDTGDRFSCNKGQPVLNAAICSGATAIRSGCHGGGCGVCKIRVLSGEFSSGAMSRAHVDPESLERHDVLACRIYPLSNLVIELLGKSKEHVKPVINQSF